MLDENTRVSYLRDPKNPDRVMTVVTQRDEASEKLSYAFSINRPTEWKTVRETKYQVVDVLDKGDPFSKRKGLDIALGRLKAKPMTIPLHGRTPRLAVLEALIDDKNGIVQRIVAEELDHVRYMAEMAEAAEVLV